MSDSRVAVVTGSDRGIGFEIVRGLASKFDGLVYLTSIDEGLGKEACARLESEGLGNIKYHQLDVTDAESIQRLADHLKKTYGGLDVLVSNAGISFKIEDRTTPEIVKAVETVKVNFAGSLNVIRALTPLLRPHARVVIVSSLFGLLRNISDPSIVKRLSSDEAVESDVIDVINDYVSAVRDGTFKERGYPGTTLSAYIMTKIGLVALAKVYQRKMLAERPDDDILVNAVCPGFCRTEMSDYHGAKSAEEGSITPIFLATIAPNDRNAPQGELWFELKPHDWLTRSYNFLGEEFW